MRGYKPPDAFWRIISLRVAVIVGIRSDVGDTEGEKDEVRIVGTSDYLHTTYLDELGIPVQAGIAVAHRNAGSTSPASIILVIPCNSSANFRSAGSQCIAVSSTKAATASHMPLRSMLCKTAYSSAFLDSGSEKRGGLSYAALIGTSAAGKPYHQISLSHPFSHLEVYSQHQRPSQHSLDQSTNPSIPSPHPSWP